jgi:hypothetical protein
MKKVEGDIYYESSTQYFYTWSAEYRYYSPCGYCELHWKKLLDKQTIKQQ